MYEEKKNFAGKVNKIASLQHMVPEAFLKGERIQCGLDAVKKTNEAWKFWIVMIIVFNTTGFAAVICVLFSALQDLF